MLLPNCCGYMTYELCCRVCLYSETSVLEFFTPLNSLIFITFSATASSTSLVVRLTYSKSFIKKFKVGLLLLRNVLPN